MKFFCSFFFFQTYIFDHLEHFHGMRQPTPAKRMIWSGASFGTVDFES